MALRKAIPDTYRDPEYLADCTQQRLECTGPASGADMAELVASTYAASEVTRKRLQMIYSDHK